MSAFLGIDVAKDTLALALLGPKTPRKTTVSNTPAGYARLVQWLASQHVTDVTVCLEATGTYSDDVTQALHDAHYRVHLVNPARETPEVPCSVVFARHEWQALVCTMKQTAEPPSEPPTLCEAVRMVAQLGDFLARTGDGEPGVKTLWRGLTRLEDIAATWLLLRGAADHQLDRSLPRDLTKASQRLKVNLDRRLSEGV